MLLPLYSSYNVKLNGVLRESTTLSSEASPSIRDCICQACRARNITFVKSPSIFRIHNKNAWQKSFKQMPSAQDDPVGTMSHSNPFLRPLEPSSRDRKREVQNRPEFRKSQHARSALAWSEVHGTASNRSGHVFVTVIAAFAPVSELTLKT
jgi:hypothetical protein